MCIPSCCENKELAEIFINWMLSEEPAVANAEYICYACPNSVVFNSEEYIEDMGEEAIEVLYPGVENFSELYNKTAYKNLDQDALAYMNTLWENLKVN
jgi:spermidine/putrescine-binding protein